MTSIERNEKKHTRILMLVVFVVLLSAPLLTWPIMRNVVDTTNYENRNFAEFPELSLENLWNVTSEFDDWFSDRVPYKNQVRHLSSEIRLAMNEHSSWLDYFGNTLVIAGKDDWLFYNGTKAMDESTVEDFVGGNLYTDEELQELSAGYQELSDQYEEKGMQFILFIPPNKEQVYPELMPDSLGIITEYSRMDQFVDYMHEHTTVNVVYAKDALLDAKEQGFRLYQKYDSHWNYLGSFVGCELLRQEILGESFPLAGREIGQMLDENGDPVPEDRDLALMLNLGEKYTEYENLAVKDYFEDRAYAVGAWTNWDNVDYVNYKNADTGNDLRLLMLRDSFSFKMEPYLARDYAEIMLLSDTKYARQYVIDTPPDVVVMEIVERKSGFLEKAWKEMLL